jgi:hypothetical protein
VEKEDVKVGACFHPATGSGGETSAKVDAGKLKVRVNFETFKVFRS